MVQCGFWKTNWYVGCMATAFFVSVIVGSVLAGVGRGSLNPPNEIMFWVGIGFLILAGFILINALIVFPYANADFPLLPIITFNVGLVMMIIGSAFIANQHVNYDVYHWVGLGLLVGWVITWIMGFIWFLVIYTSCTGNHKTKYRTHSVEDLKYKGTVLK